MKASLTYPLTFSLVTFSALWAARLQRVKHVIMNFMLDLMVYRKRAGSVIFAVSREQADGYVVLREGSSLSTTFFRIENRRLRERKFRGLLYMAVQSQALLNGLQPVRVMIK